MTVSLMAFAAACCLSSSGVTINVSCDRQNAVYGVGEEAVLSVEATSGDGAPTTSGKFSAGVDNFGTEEIVPRQEYDFAVSNPVRIRQKWRDLASCAFLST